jgi:hypothetical protein
LDGAGVGADRHRLRGAADFEQRIDAYCLARSQQHVGALRGLEAGSADLDAVVAGPEAGHLEVAFGIGLRRARHARVLVGDEHGGLRHHLLLRVADRAAEGAERRLCVSGADESGKYEEGEEATADAGASKEGVQTTDQPTGHDHLH